MYKDTVETRIRNLNRHMVNGKFRMSRGNEVSKQYVEFSIFRGYLLVEFKGTYQALLIPYKDISEIVIDEFDFRWLRIETKKERFLFTREEK